MLRTLLFFITVLALGSLVTGCSLITLPVQEEGPRQLTLQELMPYLIRLKPQAKEALALVRVPEAHKISIGAGIGVAVIDDFDGKGANSHGWQVSAVIKAVAPGSAIYPYDLNFSDRPDVFWKTVYDHMWDILKKKDSLNIRIVNMSFGALLPQPPPCTLEYLDPTPGDNELPDWLMMMQWAKGVIERGVDEGLFIVAASGNMDELQQFIKWQREFIGFGPPQLPLPACIAKVISVGAVYDSSKPPEGYSSETCLLPTEPAPDKPTCYSFLTETVDFLAPGSFWEIGDWRGERALEGTSFAAPVVAGIAALILAVKDMSPTDLKKVMRETGKYIPVTVFGHNWMPTTVQITRVDALAALCEVSPESCNPKPEPTTSLAAQYDTNKNSKLDDSEILKALDDWIRGKISDSEMMQLLSCFITNRDVQSC
jgi:subtilisin family serine protease